MQTFCSTYLNTYANILENENGLVYRFFTKKCMNYVKHNF